MREHYKGYLKTKEDEQKQLTIPNIIIANKNANKYTETFVQEHLKELPFYIHFIFGRSLTIHAEKGDLVFKTKKQEKLALFFSTFFHNYNEYYMHKKLGKFIKKQDIKLILCEFGPTGLFFNKVSTLEKVPLICIFHGYDAWNQKTITQNNYSKLFENAKAIIGVSKDICYQLEKLGCPKDKLIYLPCSYNQKLFTYTNHKNNPSIFLGIGRFAETKSPHLTILAFNEVLEEIPDAQLRMIGKDGGGELFEACHILVKALKIEDKVIFLGIKTPEEVAQEMKNARVFVQHSLTTPLMGDKEGTPVSIMEAMVSGLPIVATKHAGIQEIIKHGVSGILVDEYDYLAMANEMIRVSKSDELVEQLGKAASKAIKENDLIQDNTRILAEIIEKHRLH